MTATVVGPPPKKPCLSYFIAVELLCKSAKAMEKSEIKTIRVCVGANLLTEKFKLGLAVALHG